MSVGGTGRAPRGSDKNLNWLLGAREGQDGAQTGLHGAAEGEPTRNADHV